MKNYILLNALIISFLSTSALAHGDNAHENTSSTKKYGGHFDVNLMGISNYQSDEDENEYNELETHTHGNMFFNFNEKTSLNTEFKLAHSHGGHHHHHGDPVEDKVFQQHSLSLREFYLNHDMGNLNVYGGKIIPEVAFNYHDYPIIWAHELIEEYALEDKVGGGFGYELAQGHTLNISTFFSDTTFMSDDIFYSEGNNIDKDDHGAGNTESFENFAVNYKIDISNYDAMINFGYAMQKQAEEDEADENTFTVGAKKDFKISDKIDLSVLTEYSNVENAGGEADHRNTYYSVGGRLNYDKAFLSTVMTQRDSNHADHKKNLFSAAIGYEVFENVETSVGWKSEQENEGTRTDSAVFAVGYKYDLCNCSH